MDMFLNEAFSFPTIIFAFPLVIFLLYWLVALAGFVDLDILDFDIDTDADADTDGDGSSGGWLNKLGLDGVPLTVALTLVDLYAFAFVYLMRKYLTPLFDGLLTATAVGALFAIFAVLLAIPISAVCIKPLRRVFDTHEAVSKDSLTGTFCTVTTQTVSESFGQAVSDDDMILSVRCAEPNDIKKGSRVVLLEYLKQDDAYSVVTEQELMAASSSQQPLNS